MNHRLDTNTQVFFYENDFYPLSNFSAFRLIWGRHTFPTSEHAYQWEKFNWRSKIKRIGTLRGDILLAPSAHVAFKLAEENGSLWRPDWFDVRVDIMRRILRAKVEQHEYVRYKLLASGTRALIEDSWRDDFWGWGPTGYGKNMLGQLWMEIREEMRSQKES